MRIGGIGFDHLEMSFKNWCNRSAFSPQFSNVINSNSTVNLEITICFKNCHETAAIPNVNT